MSRGRRASAPVAPKVREMRPGDVRHVVAIERASAAIPWTRAMFLAELGRSTSMELVSVRGEEILGYLVAARYADVWHILNVCVAEEERGRGRGGELLDAAFAAGDRHAHLGYTLEVRVSNESAIGLYRAKGFEDHGIRPGYYSDNGEDALIMWRRGLPEDSR